MPKRFAFLGMVVPSVGGCIGVQTYYDVFTGNKAPVSAEQACREEARVMKSGDVDALGPLPSASQEVGALLGNSIGSALEFRNAFNACMERIGYARHD